MVSEFELLGYMPLNRHILTRCLTENAIAKFREALPPALCSPCSSAREDCYVNLSPSQVDQLADSVAGALRTTLDRIAPLKKKSIKENKLAPWFNSEARKFKQASRKLERVWRSTKLIESRQAWQESLKIYRKALCDARTSYYSSLIEANKNNHRFLFGTIARLTQS